MRAAATQGVPPNRVAGALEAAQIPAARQGCARASELSPTERRFYFWILRRFAAAAAPSAAETLAAADRFGLEASDALAALRREDLVHTDSDGRPVVAYPFSATERGHRVLIDGRWEVQAMCAIDALGIAPMLNLPVEVVSRDPTSGGEIRVRLVPGQTAQWEPRAAAVLAGSTRCDGPSFCGCCDVLNFFETAENAERYLLEHPGLAGGPISIPEAIEAGRLVFGEVLRGD